MILAPQQWPWPLDSDESRVANNAKTHGCHIVWRECEPENGVPDYAYTVGVHANFDAPELIIMGTSIETAGDVLNGIVNRIRDGLIPRDGELVEGGDHRYFKFREIDLHDALDQIDWLLWFYTAIRCEFPLMQVMWHDPKGRFPSDADCDSRAIEIQMIIGHTGNSKPAYAAKGSERQNF